MSAISNVMIRNTYLHERHFKAALLVAAALHLAGLLLWVLAPKTPVEEIPVRVLNIKLGDQEEEVDVVKSVQQTPPVKNSGVLEKEVSRYFKPQPTPQLTTDSLARQLGQAMKIGKAALKPLPAAPSKPIAATAPTTQPHQYVRAQPYDYRPLGQAPAQLAQNGGTALGNSTASHAEMLQRYGQLISLWVKKFQIYPAGAQTSTKSTAIVRIQLDRRGNVRYAALDQGSGSPLLDEAALQMIHDANPMPPVPEDYNPDQVLFQFKIPITFSSQ